MRVTVTTFTKAMRRASALAAAAWLATGTLAAAPEDYPTADIADYVFACMKSNGETRRALERCACSIDVIASIVPYERYEEASTYLSMGQVQGERGVIFRTSEQARSAIDTLRRAQAEAEVRCF